MLLRALILGLSLSPALQAAPFDKGGLLGAGAREAAMGGAVVARAEDSSALWWNPAGLQRRHDFDLGLNYGHVLGGSAFDSSFDHRGWIAPLELGYGVGYRRVAFGGVDAAEEETAIGLAFPFTQDGRLNVGFVAKALSSRLGAPTGAGGGVTARGYGLDLGLAYKLTYLDDRLSLGLAMRDLQSELEWSSGISANPVQLMQAGAAWAFDEDSSVEFDAEVAVDPSSGAQSGQGFKLGAERFWGLPVYGLKQLIALRLGYSQSSALAPSSLGGLFSAGLGLHYEGARLDYAFSQDVSNLGPTHRVSGAYRFGASGSPTASPTPTPSPSPSASPTVTPAAQPDAPWALKVAALPAVFNPNARGARLGLSLTASGPLSKAAKTSLEILPALGDAIYSRQENGLPLSLAWDGRKNNGDKVQVGSYLVQVSVLDATGLTLVSSQARFQVDLGGGKLRLLPEADIFAPIAQSARQTAGLAVLQEGINAKRWTLSIAREGSQQPLRIFSGPTLPQRIVWDGRDRRGRRVPDGGYQLSLAVVSAAGSTQTVQTRLDVDTRRPSLELAANPRVFEPRGSTGSVSFKLGLSGEAGIPARWSLNIETLEGKKLKSFAGKGVPAEELVWNGVDEQGVPVERGVLFYADYVVEMESGAVARVPRLALASKPEEPKQPFRVPLQSLRFEEGEEVIALEDFRGLKEAAEAVKKYSTDYVVVVAGYSDAGESGRAGLGELELSFLRARSVRDYLVESEGIPAGRVRVSGYGAEPLPAGALPGASARAKSRRVDVILYAQ